MTESLARRLLRLSSGGAPVILSGRDLTGCSSHEVDRLLQRRVLVELAPLDEWGSCPTCDQECGGRPIQEIDGRLIAACPHDAAADEVLSRDDVRQFQVRFDELALALREDSALAGEGPAQVADGMWLIGEVRSAEGGARTAFLAVGPVLGSPANTIAITRRWASPNAVTIVTTRAPAMDARVVFQDAGVALVPFSSALVAGDMGAFRVDLALKPPAAPAPRMSLRKIDQSVTLDGQPLTLTPQPFQLLLMLAEMALRNPALVDIRRIEEFLWGNARTTRTVADVVRELRDALAPALGGKLNAKRLVENRKAQGYRLALSPEDIAITE